MDDMQLRPSMAHLDKTAAEAAAAEGRGEDGAASGGRADAGDDEMADEDGMYSAPKVGFGQGGVRGVQSWWVRMCVREERGVGDGERDPAKQWVVRIKHVCCEGCRGGL